MRAQSKLSQVEATLEGVDGARDRMQNAVRVRDKRRARSCANRTGRGRIGTWVNRDELVNSFAVDFNSPRRTWRLDAATNARATPRRR